MKKVYWRPRGIPRSSLIMVALVSLLGFAIVELFLSRQEQPHYQAKLKAARLTVKAMNVIKAERLNMYASLDKPIDVDIDNDSFIDAETDPAQSGLIGTLMSPVTSSIGSLSAKQTSINPNFAAVILDMLIKARVKEDNV
ncbi:MAG: hypothetical protein JSV03_04470, partial [Planctomycetota bacterium]